MNTTSITLLERVTNDRQNADWVRLLSIYRPLIDFQIRSYASLRSESDDIIQDVVIVLMSELPQFQRQRKGSFRAWLRLIIVNQIRYALRRRKALGQSVSEQSHILEQVDELADPASIAAKKWDEQHDRFVFQKACEMVEKEVSTKNWLAFCRHALQHEPAQQVADDLGMSVNAVILTKSRIAARIRRDVLGLIEQ